MMPNNKRSRAAQLIIKRGLDIALSLIAMAFLTPLFLLVAIMVFVTDPGPILFRQAREGLNGVPFVAFKIRSMYAHRGDKSGKQQTTVADDRVTPIGRFLRRWSIDELPQLLNVLRGEMSLVGPRPHVAGMLAAGIPYEKLVPLYPLRLTMKPGITGWAQANGFRGPTHNPLLARARVEHDLAYIQNFSILLDLRIMLITVWQELTGGTGI